MRSTNHRPWGGRFMAGVTRPPGTADGSAKWWCFWLPPAQSLNAGCWNLTACAPIRGCLPRCGQGNLSARDCATVSILLDRTTLIVATFSLRRLGAVISDGNLLARFAIQ